VACTGATGCRFANAHTKETAEAIASWCDGRVELDSPVNIHLTGCHHSCAQHYIGDIGLIGARVVANDDGDTVDGFHLHVGGGFGPDGGIGRELVRDVRAEDVPRSVERILRAYLAHREQGETFLAFTRRQDIGVLAALLQEAAE
jgi:ferredoxin-nitrite reductase